MQSAHSWVRAIPVENSDTIGKHVQPDNQVQVPLDISFPSQSIPVIPPHSSLDPTHEFGLFCHPQLLGISQATETIPPSCGVRGRLSNSKKWWYDNLTLSNFVIDVFWNFITIFQNGYEIPFLSVPPRCQLKNNASALNNSEFVISAINDLIKNNCITEYFDVPFCCNPLTVVEGKKKRLVIDLSRSINPYVVHNAFKYDNLCTLSKMFNQAYWFITFDIESGYHHVDINVRSRKYLGFSFLWPNGCLRYFVFKLFPFGLSSACYVFTEMFGPFAIGGEPWSKTHLFTLTMVFLAIHPSELWRKIISQFGVIWLFLVGSLLPINAIGSLDKLVSG